MEVDQVRWYPIESAGETGSRENRSFGRVAIVGGAVLTLFGVGLIYLTLRVPALTQAASVALPLVMGAIMVVTGIFSAVIGNIGVGARATSLGIGETALVFHWEGGRTRQLAWAEPKLRLTLFERRSRARSAQPEADYLVFVRGFPALWVGVTETAFAAILDTVREHALRVQVRSVSIEAGESRTYRITGAKQP